MYRLVRRLYRSSYIRPYLPNKKYDAVADDDDESLLASTPEASDDAERQCRICLSCDEQEDLIAPCLCMGSVRWVHRGCLDEWRAQELRLNSFSHCELCKFEYRVQTREKALGTRLKFQLLVARDLLCFVLIVQLVVCLQAALIRGFDVGGQLASKLPTVNPLLVYYGLSALLFLAMIGLIGMCLWCHDGAGATPLCLYDPWCSASAGDCIFSACEAGEAGAACAVVLVFVLVALAVVGVIVGVFFSSVVFQHVVRRHVTLTRRRDEARHVIVLDLSQEENNDANAAGGGPISRAV